MRKRALIGLLIPAGVSMLLLALLFLALREPVYAHKPLGYWVDRLAREGIKSPPQEVEHAILGIGPNALPHLVRWIAAEPMPAWRVKFNQFVNKVAKRTVLIDNHSLRSQGSLFAFIVLGTHGKGAIPTLRKMVNDPRTHYGTVWRATACSARLGVDGLTTLFDALTNRFAGVRRYAAENIPDFATNSPRLMPLLMLCLKDPSAEVGGAAACTLGRLRVNSEVVVPELIKSLEDPRPALRKGAAEGLGWFGPDARAAVPALLKMQDANNHEFFNAGQAARDALERIEVKGPLRILISLLDDPNLDTRMAATNAILQSHPYAFQSNNLSRLQRDRFGRR